jgi:hypothetical protein
MRKEHLGPAANSAYTTDSKPEKCAVFEMVLLMFNWTSNRMVKGASFF